MLDYYKLLDLKKNASQKQIKESFRKKIKKIHPDLLGENFNARNIIEAYNVLSNLDSKREYDSIYYDYKIKEEKKQKRSTKFNYREYLKKQGDDQSFAKLIFLEIFEDNEHEAFKIYNKLVNSRSFTLEDRLEVSDYLDCAFLLAEESIKQNDYKSAYLLIKSIMIYETKKPYFKHFYDEVFNLMKKTIKKVLLNGDLNFYKNELKELLAYKMDYKGRLFIIDSLIFIHIKLKEDDMVDFYKNEYFKKV